MTRPDIAPSSRVVVAPDDVARTCRQISHDINHELATIRLLTTLLATAPDVGPESRRRAALILGETRWLEQLQRAYENAAGAAYAPLTWESSPPIRMDEVVAEVVNAMRPATLTKIEMSRTPANARVNRLALWRVVRNIVDNAIRAAGPDGTVDVRIAVDDGWAVIQVDDDGPGLGVRDSGRSTFGLNIVQDFVPTVGGHLEIERGRLGGCCIRIRIPLSGPAGSAPTPEAIQT